MIDDTITITKGRPNRQGDEKDFSGPDGTYPVMLTSVGDPVEETSRQPRTLKSGKPDPRDDGKWIYRDWTVAIESGDFEGQVLDVRASVRSTGPKSKQYGIIAAFLGRTPAEGENISIRDLVGRSALAQILTKEGTDYPYVANLMAAPVSSRVAQAQATSASISARQASAPAASPQQPAAEAPLPF